jgi:hypothetical protein
MPKVKDKPTETPKDKSESRPISLRKSVWDWVDKGSHEAGVSRSFFVAQFVRDAMARARQ